MKKKTGKRNQGFSLAFQEKIRVPGWCLFLLLALSSFGFSQELPDTIRGYKVHKEKIVVTQENRPNEKKEDLSVTVNFEDPELTDFSLLGVTFELSGEVIVTGQSGKVDFITFNDFRVNGIPVEIEEYGESFEFKKDKPFKLGKPIQIFVSTAQTLRGAVKEAKDSQDEWTVTGRAFVFGRFKKMGFNFKRVIPVDVKIKIPNPVKSY